MGLKDEKAANVNTVYVSIVNGLLHVKRNADFPGVKERTNKLGEKVYETRHKGLSGLITNVSITDADKSKYGRELIIKFVDGKDSFILQTPISGGYAYGIMSRLANLDFTKETEIRTFSIEDRTKPDGKGGFRSNNVSVLYQDATKIEALPKEEIPALEKLQVPDGKGGLMDFIDPSTKKPKWDETKRIMFYDALVYGEGGVNEQLIALYAKGVPGAASTEEGAEAEEEESEDDFLNSMNEGSREEGNGVKAEGEAVLDVAADADAQKAALEAGATEKGNNADVIMEGAANAEKTAAKKAVIKKAAAKKAAKK